MLASSTVPFLLPLTSGGFNSTSIFCGDLTSIGRSVIKIVVMCKRVQTSVSNIINKGEWSKMEPNSLRRQKFNINSTK